MQKRPPARQINKMSVSVAAVGSGPVGANVSAAAAVSVSAAVAANGFFVVR